LADPDVAAVDVPVDRDRAVGVLDAHPEPVPAGRAGADDGARRTGPDRGADVVGDVDALVEAAPPGAEPAADRSVPRGGPGQGAPWRGRWSRPRGSRPPGSRTGCRSVRSQGRPRIREPRPAAARPSRCAIPRTDRPASRAAPLDRCRRARRSAAPPTRLARL